jgi:hypothetical protein
MGGAKHDKVKKKKTNVVLGARMNQHATQHVLPGRMVNG